MDIKTLKECIKIEVIGGNHEFSWRKALTRTRRNRRKHFMFWWRVASYLYSRGGFMRWVGKRIGANLHRDYNVEIPLTVSIGPGLDIAHLSGIVITENCVIGRNLHIKQGVTIGLRTPSNEAMITIGDNVDIGCNSSILGGQVNIGDNVTIGAHALVTKSIPSNSIYINEITPVIRQKKAQ
ncbi:serine acetyltransferase [Escherichia sp. E4930]|uniref:serine acetyltransferase n=1 Tax=Escherichia sp. E4930 TaxID=2044468 RepID=UPI00107FBBEE|nr:serine acetyltransferase [Escherichia sp. E4930]TGB67843.1 transferase [Escherichia sp. E4930]TLU79571.1 serine acetyltransferase [Escherichia sp. E4930]